MKLDSLGADVGAHLDKQLEARALPPLQRKKPPPVMAIGGVVVAAAAAVALVVSQQGEDIAYGCVRAEHAQHVWKLGEKSIIVMEQGGEACLIDDKQLDTIEGRLSLDMHQPFTVKAHAHTINVGESRFDLDHPAPDRLMVNVSSGSATVVGASTHTLLAGQSLSLPAQQMPPPPVLEAPQEHVKPTRVITWQQLAQEDKHRDALALVKKAGGEKVIASSSKGDLMLLAASARYAGEMDIAEGAYRAVRARFAGTREATDAAFLLARIAMDAKHDSESARSLLQEALREDPNSTYAADARRRLEELATP